MRFEVVVPLLPVMIYRLITGTMGITVGAGASEAIRAIEAAAYPAEKKSSDNSSREDYDYGAEAEV